MTSPNVPRNAYTDAPEQHPNLIIGSLQLLWWIIFHPSAFRNHLTRIDPDLKPNSSLLIFFIRKKRYRNLALRRLLIQGKLILPLLPNLLLGLLLWLLGVSAEQVAWGVALGVVFSIVGGAVFSMAGGVVFSMAGGVVFSVALSVTLGVAWRVALGMVFSMALSAGITTDLWLPVLLHPFIILWDTLLYQLDKQRRNTETSLLRWHSAFWNELQNIPCYGLDKYVLMIMERNQDEGWAAIEYLNTSYQSWAVLPILIAFYSSQLEDCTDVRAISNVHLSLSVGQLKNPVSPLLTSFRNISEDVNAALNQKNAYNQRLALSEIKERLNGLIQECIHRNDEYTVRIYPIAQNWYKIVTYHIRELTETVELRQENDNPYFVALPLTEQQEIFTGRTDIGTRIEQLILDRRRPPLLLYGQRRMGKTSLLNNLGRLLPNSIIPMFVDLQGPVSSASDYAGFLYNIARAMIDSAKRQSAVTLPPLTRETLAVDPFTSFDEWLDKVEQTLDQNIALLSLDEFEALDDAISKGRFDEQDVLGMLRHLIQHRPRFKLLLAGSHTIEEFQRWASYLINVQVLHISYLKEPEARQLIERPVKDFTLRYEPDAVERVLQLTRCHPFLVQLLCAEIIYLKNEQDPSVRRLAKLADVEAAVPAALEHGSFFFADIQNNQVDAVGLAVLRFIAAQGEGATVSREVLSREFADNLDNILELLLRRELIEEIGESYRFQVELIRCWFATK